MIQRYTKKISSPHPPYSLSSKYPVLTGNCCYSSLCTYPEFFLCICKHLYHYFFKIGITLDILFCNLFFFSNNAFQASFYVISNWVFFLNGHLVSNGKDSSFVASFLWMDINCLLLLWRKLSTEELMLLNCGVGEDSWESLGLQRDPTSPF